MSAVLEAETPARHAPDGRGVLVIPATWGVYEGFLAARGTSCPGLRITYDRGRLEFMTISSPHDRYRYFLRRIVDTVTEELAIPVVGQGETTVRRRDLDRGFEPDEWYYIQNALRMRAVRELNFEVDPPPDLAIEIEISRSLADRIALYAAMGIPEVWRFDGEELHILHLQPDGTYAERANSLAIPQLSAADVNRVLRDVDAADTTTLFRNFRRWVRQNLVPPAGP